jgi:glycosyltransferase involved in cell wall biosynthesis
MSRALLDAGTRVVLATTDADGPSRLPAPTGTLHRFEGVPTVFFARHGGEAFKYASGLAAWLRQQVRQFDIVHVHAVFSHASLAAGREARRAGVPYIVRPLGTLDPWSLGRKRWRKTLLMQAAGRSLLTGAAAMHYTTRDEQDRAESVLTLPQGVVVPLGIEDALFDSPPRLSPERYVLSLGRLHPKKGLDLLIGAFHDLVQAGLSPGWSLIIAGDGEPAHVRELRRLADAGAGRALIRFPGWVTGDERTRLFRNASLFALASHQENFGLAVAEAMACGVPPVVSTGVNLAREIEAARAGWVVNPDRAALARVLAAVIRDERDRVDVGIRSRAFASRFRWPAVARELQALYCAVRTPAVREIGVSAGNRPSDHRSPTVDHVGPA